MEPLELSKKKLILLAVNDSVSLDCPGGTHWSLLVYDALSRRFYHLDSLTAINHSHAVNVSRKLGFLSSEFIELSSSQQNNSWDCGVYVCCHAELVLKHRFCKNESLIKTLPLLQDSDVKYYRKKTRALIESLGKMK